MFTFEKTVLNQALPPVIMSTKSFADENFTCFLSIPRAQGEVVCLECNNSCDTLQYFMLGTAQ